jgi:hypothetical protein
LKKLRSVLNKKRKRRVEEEGREVLWPQTIG